MESARAHFFSALFLEPMDSDFWVPFGRGIGLDSWVAQKAILSKLSVQVFGSMSSDPYSSEPQVFSVTQYGLAQGYEEGKNQAKASTPLKGITKPDLSCTLIQPRWVDCLWWVVSAQGDGTWASSRTTLSALIEFCFHHSHPRKELLEPYRYITALEGKGIRKKFMEAFNHWLSEFFCFQEDPYL